jgi:predicted nucleotidyltransferase
VELLDLKELVGQTRYTWRRISKIRLKNPLETIKQYKTIYFYVKIYPKTIQAY